ncbi:hypothetical protein AKO1_007620, partial [Acrasis kona]
MDTIESSNSQLVYRSNCLRVTNFLNNSSATLQDARIELRILMKSYDSQQKDIQIMDKAVSDLKQRNAVMVSQNSQMNKHMHALRQELQNKNREYERIKLEKARLEGENRFLSSYYHRDQPVAPSNKTQKCVSFAQEPIESPSQPVTTLVPKVVDIQNTIHQPTPVPIFETPKPVPDMIPRTPDPSEALNEALSNLSVSTPVQNVQISQPTVIKPRRHRPKLTTTTNIVPTQVQDQNTFIPQSEVEPTLEKRSKRQRQEVKYTEPNLRTKMRRGFEHTFGIDPHDYGAVYKHPDEVRRSIEGR